MIKCSWELDYIFKGLIEKHVYHFEIILRNEATFDNKVVGWVMANSKTGEATYRFSEAANQLMSNTSVDNFITTIIKSASELNKTIYSNEEDR